MISEETIRQQLNNTIEKTNFPELGEKYTGKVRDNYMQGARRIIITTDRISAFDRVLGTIPFKGSVLNQLAVFWFEKTKGICQNHIIDVPDQNVMVAKECKPLPVEVVVRGYITGVTTTSLWQNYHKGLRDIYGLKFPDGLVKNQKLDKPIITPTTKAEQGRHDRPISREEIINEGLVDRITYEKIEKIALSLFEDGTKFCAKNDLILVDTKYEFGIYNGEITLMDEIHTPDSSRFWIKSSYDCLFNEGKEPEKLDKEYVRVWLANQGYAGNGHPPKLTDGLRIEAAKKYIRAYEKITGETFKAEPGKVLERIRKNLIEKGYLK